MSGALASLISKWFDLAVISTFSALFDMLFVGKGLTMEVWPDVDAGVDIQKPNQYRDEEIYNSTKCRQTTFIATLLNRCIPVHTLRTAASRKIRGQTC